MLGRVAMHPRVAADLDLVWEERALIRATPHADGAVITVGTVVRELGIKHCSWIEERVRE